MKKIIAIIMIGILIVSIPINAKIVYADLPYIDPGIDYSAEDSANLDRDGIINGENIKNEQGSYGILYNVSQAILNIIFYLGYAIAIGMLIWIGIKYMMSTASERAKLKGTFTMYIIGVILIVSCSTISLTVAKVIGNDDANDVTNAALNAGNLVAQDKNANKTPTPTSTPTPTPTPTQDLNPTDDKPGVVNDEFKSNYEPTREERLSGRDVDTIMKEYQENLNYVVKDVKTDNKKVVKIMRCTINGEVVWDESYFDKDSGLLRINNNVTGKTFVCFQITRTDENGNEKVVYISVNNNNGLSYILPDIGEYDYTVYPIYR